jgi:hypothetical protein
MPAFVIETSGRWVVKKKLFQRASERAYAAKTLSVESQKVWNRGWPLLSDGTTDWPFAQDPVPKAIKR